MTGEKKILLTKPIETECCTFQVTNNCIVVTKFRHGATVGVDDMKDIEEILFKITERQPFLTLLDLSNKYVSFDDEARAYAAQGPITGNIISQAIVVNTLPVRMVVNFYLRFNRPRYPARAFNKNRQAIDWLMQQHQS